MKNTLKVQVIMLPTTNKRDKSNLFKRTNGEVQYINWDVLDREDWKPQHLYFTSSEPMIKDDWLVNTNAMEINRFVAGASINKGLSKIIATSDVSLGLPLIPESFIKSYVESQGSIKEVEINIVKADKPYNYTPLLDGINGCISIHKPEPKLYTREEINQFLRDLYFKITNPIHDIQLDKWIKDTLK